MPWSLDMIEAKKCGLCYEWLDVAEMQWDAEMRSRTATSARTTGWRRALPADGDVRSPVGASHRATEAV